jgi:hypothetical protein
MPQYRARVRRRANAQPARLGAELAAVSVTAETVMRHFTRRMKRLLLRVMEALGRTPASGLF